MRPKERPPEKLGPLDVMRISSRLLGGLQMHVRAEKASRGRRKELNSKNPRPSSSCAPPLPSKSSLRHPGQPLRAIHHRDSTSRILPTRRLALPASLPPPRAPTPLAARSLDHQYRARRSSRLGGPGVGVAEGAGAFARGWGVGGAGGGGEGGAQGVGWVVRRSSARERVELMLRSIGRTPLKRMARRTQSVGPPPLLADIAHPAQP